MYELRATIHRFKKSDFLKSITVLVSGNALAQLISLITVPIVSRIYSVEAFGEYALFASIVSIASSIVTMGLGSAIMAPKDNIEASKILYSMSLFSFINTTILFLCFYLFFSKTNIIKISLSVSELGIWLYLNTLSACFLSAVSIYVNRIKRTKLLFWNTIINSLSTLTITIPLGYFNMGVKGFIIASFVASFIAITQMCVQAKPIQKIFTLAEIWVVIKNYNQFIYFQLPANIISGFSLQLPNQFFSKFLGNTILGAYSMCDRILGYPIRLIAAPVATIYFRHATGYVQENRMTDLSDFTIKIVRNILLISFFPVLIITLFSKNIFVFLLGAKWSLAGEIASILLCQYVFVFCHQSLSYALVVIEKQKANFFLSFLQLIITVVSLVLGILYFKKPLIPFWFFGIGNTLIQVMYIGFIFHYMGRNLFKFIAYTVFYFSLIIIFKFAVLLLS